jgi:hypothetical protein
LPEGLEYLRPSGEVAGGAFDPTNAIQDRFRIVCTQIANRFALG